MTRLLAALLALLLVVGAACGGGTSAVSTTASDDRDLGPFRSLGTWVDVYDYAPRFQGTRGGPPAVTPASLDDMARLGINTLYLQAAQDDSRSEGDLVDRALVGEFLRRAHRRGVKVVAWYLPHFLDVGADLRRVRALARFRSGGEQFDGIALDIEWTSDVDDATVRNDALIALSRRARAVVGNRPLGAIALEPVLIEDVNPSYWPGFPWKRLRAYYDVWLPMVYWTNRTASSGWREAQRYTAENVRRVRADLGDRNAPVHAIGGVGDTATAGDYEGFVRAAKAHKTIGWSIYDYFTTSSAAWPRLRG